MSSSQGIVMYQSNKHLLWLQKNLVQLWRGSEIDDWTDW